MSKPLVGLAVGLAQEDGEIALDDALERYVADLAGTAYGQTSIRHLLRMSSGAALFNSFEPGVDTDNRAVNPLIMNQGRGDGKEVVPATWIARTLSAPS